MSGAILLVAFIIAGALAFDYVNGFHDAANSIATVVSTRVLTPMQAVAWAAFFNFVAAGSLWLRRPGPRMTNRSSGARSAISGVMLLLLGATSAASAGDVGALVAPFLAARERGSLGSVEGRAYAEGRPGGEAKPYASVSVFLLPRSAAFEAELEAIKAHSRDSPDAYIEAEPKLSAARQAFERTLIDTGAGQLILGGSSDSAGAFRFQRVPEGSWMLLAWREMPHAKRPPGPKRGEVARYKTRPQVFGQATVTYWWRPVTVKAGEEAAVHLHDRNEWFTGVREDRRISDPNRPTIPSVQQGAAPR